MLLSTASGAGTPYIALRTTALELAIAGSEVILLEPLGIAADQYGLAGLGVKLDLHV